MSTPSSFSSRARLLGLATLVLAQEACVPRRDAAAGGDTATLELALTQAPSDVRCLRLVVDGTRRIVRTADVIPGASSRATFAGLPEGAATIGAEAFSTSCAELTDARAPWVGGPESALLQLGQVAVVTLAMRRNGLSHVTIGYEDDGSDAGTAAEAGTTADAGPPPGHFTLYATGVTSLLSEESALFSIDPLSGAATGLFAFGKDINISNGGLAYYSVLDLFYATGVDNAGVEKIFVIDRRGHGAGAIGETVASLSTGGLAMDPSETVLYATGYDGQLGSSLFTIDLQTGRARVVGSNSRPSGPIIQLGGLGFQRDGTLFANGLTLADPTMSHLFKVDLATGLATDIGPSGVSVGRSLFNSGLAPRDDRTMFSIGSTSESTHGLYVIDIVTGVATVMGQNVLYFGVEGGLVRVPQP
jgi:hypothetical protein